MNKLPVVIALTIVSCASIFAAAENVEKQLAANYSAMGTAFKKKDIEAYGKFYLPTFVGKDLQGHDIPLKIALNSLKQQMVTATEVVWSRTIKKCKVTGNEATVTIDGVFKGSVPFPDGKRHKVEAYTTAENVWAKVGKTWLLKSAKPISNRLLENGKPMKVGRPTVTHPVKAGN